MKKHNWLLDHLFLICALLWYLVAVLKFWNGSQGVVTWFCFGSCYLCIYSVQMNKRLKEKADRENSEKHKNSR